jgi:hypothetical protein
MKNFTIQFNSTDRHFELELAGTTRNFEIRPGVGPQGPPGEQGPTGPNTITTSTTTNLTGFISGNGSTVSGATVGASSATPNTLVLRNAQGGGVSFAETANDSTAVTISNTGSSDEDIPIGLRVISTGGESISLSVSATGNQSTGANISSINGDGAIISTDSGEYHATFGTQGINHSFVARVKGSIGWFRNDEFTARIHPVDTITDDRTYTLPDASGTVALTSQLPDLSTAVLKSAYTPAHSILAQQSGTGSPTAVTLGNNTILGRMSGGGSAIAGLSASNARTVMGLGTLATVDGGTGVATALAVNTGSAGAIVVNGGTATDMTLAGSAAFTSTTRPTSAGTGTPGATSLITRADGDDRFLRCVTSRTTANTDNATTTLADTGLSVALDVGVWDIDALITLIAQDFSTEPGYAVRPIVDSGTITMAQGRLHRGTNNNAGLVFRYDTAGGFPIATLSSTADAVYAYRFTVNVTVAGSLKFQFRQNATSTKYVRVMPGSFMIATRLP